MRVTKKDIDEMQKEIEERKYVLRPKLIEDLKEARAQGDLSENFEYYVAKREKNRNESRIRYLDKLIKTATILNEDSATDEIGIGDEVTLEYEDDGFCDSYLIVSTYGADSLNNKISVESPVGKAILKKKTGDRVLVSVGNNADYYVKIINIKKA